MPKPTQLSAAVIDAANIWGASRTWRQTSTPEMKLSWEVSSIEQLIRPRERADVLFITTNERRGDNLGFMILNAQRHAADIIVAARYFSGELLHSVKERGALGAVRATTAPTDSFKESYPLLGIDPGSKRIGPQNDQEREAIHLFKQGYPLLLIGSSINKPSGWVIELLAREGLRKRPAMA